MSKLWLQGGKLLRDGAGRLLLCEQCPCGPAPVLECLSGSLTCRWFADLFATFTLSAGCFTGSHALIYVGFQTDRHVWESAQVPCTTGFYFRITLTARVLAGQCRTDMMLDCFSDAGVLQYRFIPFGQLLECDPLRFTWGATKPHPAGSGCGFGVFDGPQVSILVTE